MDADTLAAFREAAARFAAGEVRPMIGDRWRDGDLDRLPAVLESAEATGLMASADPSHPGHDYGVWGRAVSGDGPAPSLAVLEEIAVECAGVATCLHAAGLGALALPDGKGHRTAAAFLPGGTPLHAAFPGVPEGTTGWRAVMLPPGCEAVVLHTGGTSRRLVPLAALEVEEMKPRTGLAAVRLATVRLGDPGAGEPLPPADPADLAIPWLLGIAAMAAGAARGALEVAAAYARERRQGGRTIVEHPAVQLLLGEAASRVAAARAHLDSAGAAADMEAALAARLRVVEDAFQAATESLQVLGGYGYMEDYGVEKRLRDIMTLRGLPPSPDVVRRLLAGGER